MRRACVWLALALALESAAFLGAWWIGAAAYGGTRALDEPRVESLTCAALAVGGPLAFLASAIALHRLLRAARGPAGFVAIALAALPITFVAALLTYVLVAVRGWC